MKYFQMLTKEYIQTICQNYPHKEMIQGFKKYPKAFNEIAKGYRPQSIPADRVADCYWKIAIQSLLLI